MYFSRSTTFINSLRLFLRRDLELLLMSSYYSSLELSFWTLILQSLLAVTHVVILSEDETNISSYFCQIH